MAYPAKASAGTWVVRAECMAYTEHKDGSSRLRLGLQALKPGPDGKPIPNGLSATLLDLSEQEAHHLAKLPIAERAALAATLLHEVQRTLWLRQGRPDGSTVRCRRRCTMNDPPALRRILAKADNYCHDLDMSSITPREAHRWIRSAYRAGQKAASRDRREGRLMFCDCSTPDPHPTYRNSKGLSVCQYCGFPIEGGSGP